VAVLSITIADADLPRVVHALCVTAGVTETVPNAKQVVIQRIKEMVQSVERNDAMNAAIVANSTNPQVVVA
jgi:hypothetical protein